MELPPTISIVPSVHRPSQCSPATRARRRRPRRGGECASPSRHHPLINRFAHGVRGHCGRGALPLHADPRLMKEYHDLTADPINDTLTAGPVSEGNMLEWEALIQGPEDTPYVSPERSASGREAWPRSECPRPQLASWASGVRSGLGREASGRGHGLQCNKTAARIACLTWWTKLTYRRAACSPPSSRSRPTTRIARSRWYLTRRCCTRTVSVTGLRDSGASGSSVRYWPPSSRRPVLPLYRGSSGG